MSDYILKTDGDVTISLNEYRYLLKESAKREYFEKTIEMVLDYLKEHSRTNFNNTEVRFSCYDDLTDLADVFKYRHPDEFTEMEELVKFRAAQEPAELERDDEDDDA